MAISTRVRQLEKVHQVNTPFDPFEGRSIPDGLYEAVSRYEANRSKEGFQDLLSKYPDHNDVISDILL
jgi:hypothetical protein